MKDILFRARGNNIIGMGHIVRCMALAKELKKKYSGANIIFITEDKDAAKMARESGYRVENPGKNDITCIKKLASDKTVLITDVLNTGKKYIKELKKIKGLKVASIDNNTKFKKIDADILINANIFSGKKNNAKIFLGPKYMLLRKEFSILSKHNKKIRDKVKIITIMSGGADRKKLALNVAKALEKIGNGIKINLISGPACLYVKEIKKFSAESGVNFNIMLNPENLSEIMKESDLAITAAGVALFEFASLGVPCIVIPQARHQEIIADNFAKKGACINLGKLQSRENILKKTLMLAKNKNLRKKISQKSKIMVDGKGMERAIKLISSL